MINYTQHSITKEDEEAVLKALKRPKLTQGELVEEFEKAICKYTGAKYCVVVNSGTAALTLAYRAINDSQNIDNCYIPDNTFIATYNAAEDIFSEKIQIVPVDIKTGLLPVESKYCSRDLIVPVHIGGVPIDMKELKKLNPYSFMVEDACHAFGASYLCGAKVGSCKYSDLTVFSFHPAKTITTGEGGAITTNNKEYYEHMKRFRSHGRLKNTRCPEIGYNFRLPDMNCALGLSQLNRADSIIRERQASHVYYNCLIEENNSYFEEEPLSPPEILDNSAFNLYEIRLTAPIAKKVRAELLKRDIISPLIYPPVPWVVEGVRLKTGQYKRMNHSIILPLYESLEARVQEHISEVLFYILTKT